MQQTLIAWQNAIGHWPIADYVRATVWAKALLESAHVAAMGLVLFAVGMIAVRLMGGLAKSGPVTEMVRRYNPWIWGALVVVFATGVILLTGAGRGRGLNTPMFQLKMVLMVVSILVTFALTLTLNDNRSFWELGTARRMSVKFIAPLTVLLWMATVIAGRWLAYGYVLFPNG